MNVQVKSLCGWWILALLSVSSLVAQDRDLRLVDAVKEGQQETLRALLNEGIDVNIAQVDGVTALHWAAHRNDLASAKLLIGKGAQVNAANDYGVTALSLACTNANAAVVEALMQAGADPNSAQWTGETVLMTCARTGSAAAVKSLLTSGADPNAKETRWEQTALMWALAADHPATARTLMEHGANVQARSKAGFTPLMFAAQQGDMDSVRALLAAGAEINAATPQHGNVLTVASGSGHEALSIFLLEKGADPNSPDHRGVTPLHYAVPQGLSTFDGLKYDGVYRPMPPNMPKLVKALLAHGADPNAQIARSEPLGPESPSAGVGMAAQTPLFLAALAADVEIIQILADNGADPRLGSYSPMSGAENDTTPLMAAAGESRYRWKGTLNGTLGDPLGAVELLVKLGADVNRTTSSGQTALHSAALAGDNEIVRFLVDQGAEVDLADRSGQTPWTLARGLSPSTGLQGRYDFHESTADLLLELGAVERTLKKISRGDPGGIPPGGPPAYEPKKKKTNP
jgi:ankyrin repeat protein